MAGFGLHDEEWAPFVHAKKGYGSRAAHDNAVGPFGKDPQIERFGIIYG